MRKSLFGLIFILSIFSIVSCTDSKTKVIKVFGNGEVTYIPDTVTMTVKLKSVKPVLRDAISETNATSKKLLSLCKEYSILDEDIKTSFSQSGREYEYQNGRNVFVGFRSEQSIQITFRDLTRVEEFTGAILALQVYSLGDFRYSHSKKSEFESEANLLALDDAKAAAEKMAERMNVKIGEVLYISDVDTSEPSYYYRDSYESIAQNKSLNSSSGFVVAPGILASSKNVVVTFELKNKD
ncbi:SIMPL domain-containing protein [Treponema zioleckii]|uniref:SIMPL domain-containing protein n=1 Tax=Treponema zioleckii TaxID=331680 RepID=UPI00168B6B54|nr:SIMPL domain-containing protein [Treponema zioleckii]